MILVFKRKFDFLNLKKIDMVRNATRIFKMAAILNRKWQMDYCKYLFKLFDSLRTATNNVNYDL